MNTLTRFFSKYTIWIYAVLAFVFMLIPIVYTIAFSFNDSVKSNLVWRGFTFDNWTTDSPPSSNIIVSTTPNARASLPRTVREFISFIAVLSIARIRRA